MEPISSPDSEEEENLISQIEDEMRKIYLSVEKLYNNASLSETTDPLEKCFITNYYYSSCLLDQGVHDDDRNEDALKSFEESLQRELDFLTNDMDKLLVKMNDYKEQFNRAEFNILQELKQEINNLSFFLGWLALCSLVSIDNNIANLKQMMEAQKNERKADTKLDAILKNLRIRFRKEKADLKAIVSSLFPESFDIRDLIARIIDHHFTEGSDKYLQLEDSDNIAEQIELLRRTRLFETNPHDPLQIKLADLV